MFLVWYGLCGACKLENIWIFGWRCSCDSIGQLARLFRCFAMDLFKWHFFISPLLLLPSLSNIWCLINLSILVFPSCLVWMWIMEFLYWEEIWSLLDARLCLHIRICLPCGLWLQVVVFLLFSESYWWLDKMKNGKVELLLF